MSSQEATPESGASALSRASGAFAAGYGQPFSQEMSSVVSNWLATILTTTNQRWPDIAFEPEAFARDLGARVAAAGCDLKAEPHLHAVDLFLVCACVANVPHAASTFDREQLRGIGPQLRHIDASTPFAEEVRQCLRHKLLVANAGEVPRIAGYSGRGPLTSWVAVAAQREALTLKRASGRRQRTADEHAASLLPSSRDPELMYMKERYRHEFEQAFRLAVAELSDRDRVVLRFALVERVSQTQIGLMYQVNQATVHRWVARSREQIIARMLQIFHDRMGLGQSDFASVVRLVKSEIDLNVSQLLTDITPQRE